MLARTVTPETLDHLPEHDPRAQRSRADLRRVHRAMLTVAIVSRALRAAAAGRGAPRRILELGAGDGTLMLRIARRLAPRWPGVRVALLDRQDLVAPATLAGFEALGWRAEPLRVDALDWAAQPDAARWDLVVANLFLHHFEGAALVALLDAAAGRAAALVACEPRRSRTALAGSHLVGALGANAVTRADAVASVHAGFAGRELSAAWPQAGWRLNERAAGPFSHLFTAVRPA